MSAQPEKDGLEAVSNVEAMDEPAPPPPRQRDRRVSALRRGELGQSSRLHNMIVQKKVLDAMMATDLSTKTSEKVVSGEGDEENVVDFADITEEEKKEVMGLPETMEASSKIQEILSLITSIGVDKQAVKSHITPLETRVDNFTFSVPVDDDVGKITTVYNSSFIYSVVKFMKRLWKGDKAVQKTRKILDGIDLIFEPGKSYLLLGAPGSGRTSLLKAIAGILHASNKDVIEGSISYNGRTLKEKGEFHIENAFAYVDQLDKHAPRLTVQETFDFACDCKGTGEVGEEYSVSKEKSLPTLILASLGLTNVKDTFVGDSTVRGVSGGQRRRVTTGEMICARASVFCGDEISTGLDATSTYDMIQVLTYITRLMKMSRVVSLLQPSPETVSLFDEVIVMAEGKILYAGPVQGVEDYFAEIGFVCPDYVDVADFLQLISTGDGTSLFSPDSQGASASAPSISELADIFRQSDEAKRIRKKLESPHMYLWKQEETNVDGSQVSRIAYSRQFQKKYANSFFRSTKLIMNRFLILWVRDKRVIMASFVKNVIMGISVGGCYLSTTNEIQIQGALFQCGLFIILGSMQSASALVNDRVLYYKHKDANFYSAWPFVYGRTLSQFPQVIFDTVMFATILYFMVGLADRESGSNFFIFLSLLFVFALLMIQQLAVFASFASAGDLNAFSSCVVLLLILFGGFIIVPDTVPMYYSWIYWWNPLAWIYRGLILNEFYSERWEGQSAQILINAGFVGYDGVPYGKEWIGYAFAYCVPYTILCSVLTALGLTFSRDVGKPSASSVDPAGDKDTSDAEQKKTVQIPLKPVTLSFRDVSYEVTASTSSETLRLLQNVSGIFRSGRLCALMGTSGAGKTTLMDVIALRKYTGRVTGTICLNGWPQEKVSFRRCSGYVEQFDVQSPELTVRESILFSARLRLDPDLVKSDEDIQAFVDLILDQAELTSLKDALVGTDEGVGLSFEQKKRLSIAVELAASPSIIFLDEPTSGLDGRSAGLVVRTLRGIADSGRTVVATIHQPSSAVFGMFDDLLLLRRGGQVVFHGELGKDCKSLISYFESRGAPAILLGDNPANWMLRVMDSGTMGDLAESYVKSEECAALSAELDAIGDSQESDSKIEYTDEFAVSASTRRRLLNGRLVTIYWRSPSYNYSRLIVSLIVAFVMGSVFVTKRDPPAFTESDMRGRVSVIFLTFIITGIMAIMSVLPVMAMIRDLYYRHRDAGMYDSGSMAYALGVAEKGFILFSTLIFTIVFLGTSGIVASSGNRLRTCIGFWGFFTFNVAIYSYFGQLFVCSVKSMGTALILCSVFLGLNNFFSGLVVRPQFMVGTFYAFPYWITPGHFVYDGLITSIYNHNNATVTADADSEFEQYLQSINQCPPTGSSEYATTVCQGTAYQYVNNFFGGQFMSDSAMLVNALVLGFILALARVLTWLALKYIRYSN